MERGGSLSRGCNCNVTSLSAFAARVQDRAISLKKHMHGTDVSAKKGPQPKLEALCFEFDAKLKRNFVQRGNEADAWNIELVQLKVIGYKKIDPKVSRTCQLDGVRTAHVVSCT